MERECQESGNTVRWQVFEWRILRPLFGQCAPASYDELTDRWGVADKASAMNLLVNGKRHFNRAITAVLGRCQQIPATSTASDDEASRSLHDILNELLLNERRDLQRIVDQLATLCEVERERDESISVRFTSRQRFPHMHHGLKILQEFSSGPAQDADSKSVLDTDPPDVSTSPSRAEGTQTALLADLFREAGNARTDERMATGRFGIMFHAASRIAVDGFSGRPRRRFRGQLAASKLDPGIVVAESGRAVPSSTSTNRLAQADEGFCQDSSSNRRQVDSHSCGHGDLFSSDCRSARPMWGIYLSTPAQNNWRKAGAGEEMPGGSTKNIAESFRTHSTHCLPSRAKTP